MENLHWVVVEEVSGGFQAEILRGLLEAQGVQAVISQEGLGRSVYAMTIGDLGRAQIMVPSTEVERAMQILEDYRAGKFENPPSPAEDSD